MTEDFPARLAGFGPGSLVASYRLEAQVGAGGMAVVFRARDERLGRQVALKILAPALAADDGFRRRFIAESRAAAAVDDPHIIPVYEAGEADGALFIAMRYVAGGDLRRVLEREGSLTPARAAAFISPVASALDAAHAAGLVHRDVKPANVLVDARPGRPDHVYLSDFGVSKGAKGSVSSVSLTGTGQFLGTPDYSAPEQVQGRVMDGRTDQYALACVAYELLTGVTPFARDQGMAVLLAHLSEPPPALRARRPDLPAAAGQVLARAMAKAPQERYASCRDFAEALRAALGVAPYNPASAGDGTAAGNGTAAGRGGVAEADTLDPMSAPAVGAWHRVPTAPGPGSRRRPIRRRVLAVLAGAVLVAAAIVVPLLTTSTGPSGPSHPSSSSTARNVVAGKLLTTLASPGQIGADHLVFSPDGATLAGAAGNNMIFLWQVPAGKLAAALAERMYPGPITTVAFSPNGAMLATADNYSRILLWNVATGKRTITLSYPAKNTDIAAVAFSPDGKTLATTDYTSTHLWQVATGTQTAVLSDSAGMGDAVAFSPDGAMLAVATNGGSTLLWNLSTRKVAATLSEPDGENTVWSVAFSRDGATLATADASGHTYLWNLATDKVIAAFTDPGSKAETTSVAFSPDGAMLATADTDGSTYLWNVATRKLAATLADPARDPRYRAVLSVAFSPNGALLATSDNYGGVYLWKVS